MKRSLVVVVFFGVLLLAWQAATMTGR